MSAFWTAGPGATPRARMVQAAMELIRKQGVSGTGMREIVERANAPRGSLQHYFPGGKDQLVMEALDTASDWVAGMVDGYMAAVPDASPGDLFAAIAGWWRELYRREGYADGCPFAATVADTATTVPVLRHATKRGLDAWQASIERGLVQSGVAADRAPGLALLMMTSLEGALILARAREDVTPLDAVINELRPALDAAAPRRGRQPRRVRRPAVP